MEYIEQLAKHFRGAIEIAKNADEFRSNSFSRFNNFSGFPRECCDDASILLAEYLLVHDIITDNVFGNYKGYPHAWLLDEHDNFIDITGDQFNNNRDFPYSIESVYVGADNDFHRLFKNRTIRADRGIDSLGDGCQPRLNDLYSKIIKHIK
ncbi:MAG: hypothetical protein FWC92_03075 [Defluviitaleaceae bacterium]|nr:hypothetical protein [Defluviitaleaceae bacterium]